MDKEMKRDKDLYEGLDEMDGLMSEGWMVDGYVWIEGWDGGVMW